MSYVRKFTSIEDFKAIIRTDAIGPRSFPSEAQRQLVIAALFSVYLASDTVAVHIDDLPPFYPFGEREVCFLNVFYQSGNLGGVSDDNRAVLYIDPNELTTVRFINSQGKVFSPDQNRILAHELHHAFIGDPDTSTEAAAEAYAKLLSVEGSGYSKEEAYQVAVQRAISEFLENPFLSGAALRNAWQGPTVIEENRIFREDLGGGASDLRISYFNSLPTSFGVGTNITQGQTVERIFSKGNWMALDLVINFSKLHGSSLIVGGTGKQRIIGGVGNDFLYGMGGTDTLSGGKGNDLLDGGDGEDTVRYVWTDTAYGISQTTAHGITIDGRFAIPNNLPTWYSASKVITVTNDGDEGTDILYDVEKIILPGARVGTTGLAPAAQVNTIITTDANRWGNVTFSDSAGTNQNDIIQLRASPPPTGGGTAPTLPAKQGLLKFNYDLADNVRNAGLKINIDAATGTRWCSCRG
jgi:Ca2+-binding RTX toxin-like protein